VKQFEGETDMPSVEQNYSLFLKFFNAYAPAGFMGIDPADP